jgi:hypothetical protein
MQWIVHIGVEFVPELRVMPFEVRQEILAMTDLLELHGPQLGRPRVDTLNGSRHANMKGCVLMRLTESGGWPSPLIQSARLFCWSQATNPG